MSIKVRYLGLIYSKTGRYEEDLGVHTPITVGEILDIIFEKYEGLRELIMTEDGYLNPLYRILINGRDIEHLEGLSTVVEDGDVVTLSTPFGG